MRPARAVCRRSLIKPTTRAMLTAPVAGRSDAFNSNSSWQQKGILQQLATRGPSKNRSTCDTPHPHKQLLAQAQQHEPPRKLHSSAKGYATARRKEKCHRRCPCLQAFAQLGVLHPTSCWVARQTQRASSTNKAVSAVRHIGSIKQLGHNIITTRAQVTQLAGSSILASPSNAAAAATEPHQPHLLPHQQHPAFCLICCLTKSSTPATNSAGIQN